MTRFELRGKNGFQEKTVAFFTKNLLFFAALVLALLIWYAIRSQFRMDKAVDVTVVAVTDHKEVPLGTPSPEKITVFLSGSRSLLNNFTGQEVKLELSTSQAKREDKDDITVCSWNVEESDIAVPFGIRVKKLGVRQVKLSLDRISSKKLPVEAVLDEGKLAKGYKIGKVTVEPEMVTVTAPSTKLRKLRSIRTVPISLENITHSFDCDQEFDAENYSHIDFDRKNVLVQVEILRAIKTRSFKTLPVRILVPPASPKHFLACEIVSSPTVDLEVSGAENVINSLRRDDVFIFANVSEFTNPGLVWIDLRCAIDKNGITSYKIIPSRVSVKLERVSKP